MRPRGRLSQGLVLLTVAFTASGCSTPFFVGDWSIDDIQPTLPEETAETVVEVDINALERVEVSPRWQRTYDGVLGAQLGPSGDHTVVFGSLPGGLGFDLLDAAGSKQWEFRYADRAFRSARVDISGHPAVVAAVAGDGSAQGQVQVFDLQGSELWRLRAAGSSSLVVSPDASRFALLDPVAGHLLLLDAAGRQLGEAIRISPDASAAFYRHKNLLLVNDADHVRLISQVGEPLLSQEIGREFERSVVLSPDGERVAVTTTGADSTAYVFDTQGRLLWSKPLFLGGTNEPVFSPDGDTLYIYTNTGDTAGIYGLDAAAGAVTMRLFPAAPEGRKAGVRRMWTTDTAVVIDYVMSPRGTGSDGDRSGEEHVLLVASPDASRLRRIHLGTNVEVDLSGDGKRLLVVKRQAASSGPMTTMVVYDLEPVIPPNAN